MSLLLGNIVEKLGGELLAPPDVEIHSLAPLESARADQLSFLSHPKYQAQLAASQAACVIVGPAMREAALARGGCIVTDNFPLSASVLS